jgi:hypothetical protein
MISTSERQAPLCLCFLNAITAPFKELPDRGFFRPIALIMEDNIDSNYDIRINIDTTIFA